MTTLQKEVLTWIAVPDDAANVANRSVTWHLTREAIRLDGMSNVVSPELILTLCREALARYRISRTAQRLPEILNDRRCACCTHPDLSAPDGWTLELLERRPDYALLSTPSPRQFMATIDFRMRGFRSGYSTTGRLFGEEWNKRRKKYGGRGWKQSLVDDAVAHLQEVLR